MNSFSWEKLSHEPLKIDSLKDDLHVVDENIEKMISELSKLNIIVEKYNGGMFKKEDDYQAMLESVLKGEGHQLLIKGIGNLYPSVSKFTRQVNQESNILLNSRLYIDSTNNEAPAVQTMVANTLVLDFFGGCKWIFPKNNDASFKDFSRFQNTRDFVEHNKNRLENKTIVTGAGDWLYIPAGTVYMQDSSQTDVAVCLLLSEVVVTMSEILDQVAGLTLNLNNPYQALSKEEAMEVFSGFEFNREMIERNIVSYFERSRLLKLKFGNK